MTETELENLKLQVRELNWLKDQTSTYNALIKQLKEPLSNIITITPFQKSFAIKMDEETTLEFIKLLEHQRDKYQKNFDNAKLSDGKII